MNTPMKYYKYLRSIGHEPDMRAFQLGIRRPGLFSLADETPLNEYSWINSMN